MAGEAVRVAAPAVPIGPEAGGGTLMRKLYTPLVMGVCLLGPGCSFVHHIIKNMVNEPILACDEKVILHRHERLARMAWDEMCHQYGEQFSEDYRDGFIDGFTDYLTYGGCIGACGEAPIVPPVPPVHYRRKGYMTPQGYRAIEEWFVGFRHGASTAVASGLRQLVVIPVSDPPVVFGRPNPFAPPGYGGTPASAGRTEPPQAPPPPAGETLPPPRTVPPADRGLPPPRPVPPAEAGAPAPQVPPPAQPMPPMPPR
jgi:hypothetical protein